jgi:hypothetical protein
MKKMFKVVSFIAMTLILLIGCNSVNKEKNVDKFINKLISMKTYEDMNFDEYNEKLAVDLVTAFDEYLTDNAMDILLLNRVPSIYGTVINESSDITDVKITKVKENKYNDYTHYEYEVSYKLKSDNDFIDMTDYIAFKINEDSLIAEVYVLDKKSSIYNEYKKYLTT